MRTGGGVSGAGGGTGGDRRAASRLAGAVVLVAEDDAVIALDLESVLRQFGCRVLGPAGSVDDALALLAGHQPDAALLDVGLLDGSSARAAEALARAGVPFALVTGYDREGIGDHPALRGAPLLAKPYATSALKAVVLHLVQGRADDAS